MNGITKPIVTLLALAAVLTSAPRAGEGPTHDELTRLESSVERAMLQADGAALRELRQRLLDWPDGDSPRRARALGLANLFLVVTGEAGDEPMELLDDALDAFAAAEERGADDVLFYVTRIYCNAMRMMTQASCAQATQPEIDADVQRLMFTDPSHPCVRFLFGLNSISTASPSREALASLDDVLAAFAEARAPTGQPADWFELNAYFMVARGWLALGEAGIDAARRLYERALELRPDFTLLENVIGPQLVELPAASAEAFDDLRWTVVSTDAEGDHTAGADGRSLGWALDGEADVAWFRFRYFGGLLPDKVSVNVAFDVDGDPDDGLAWWGGDDTDFHLDRVATVWVNRTESGRYRGLVGMADAPHARAMLMNNVSANTIALSVDEDAGTVTVGIPRDEILEADAGAAEVRVLGAVGTGMSWSDNLVASETISLGRTPSGSR